MLVQVPPFDNRASSKESTHRLSPTWDGGRRKMGGRALTDWAFGGQRTFRATKFASV
jgi:hypothetical protein